MTISVQEQAQKYRECNVGIDYGRTEITPMDNALIEKAKEHFKGLSEPLNLEIIYDCADSLYKCSLHNDNPDICEVRDCPMYNEF